MKKVIIKFGLIAGVIITLSMTTVSWSESVMNSSYAAVIGYAAMVVAFSMIFVAVNNYKNNTEDGKVSFGKAFIIGLSISLIGSVFYVVTWGFVDGFSGGDFIEQYEASAMLKLKEEGATAAEIKLVKEKIENYRERYKNPVTKMLITSTEILPVGILVSLINAFIFMYLGRKK